MNPAYTVRPATAIDSRFIYLLSSDPRIREQSTRSDFFEYAEHERWYEEKLSNGLNAIWIMEAPHGLPVGMVRYGKVLVDCEWCPDTPSRHCCKWEAELQAEIAIAIVPSEQRKGYGLALLRETMPLARDWLSVDTLVALVLRNNRGSRALFRCAGFRYVGCEVRMNKVHARYESEEDRP